MQDSFSTKGTLDGNSIVDLNKAGAALGDLSKHPISLRILLENLLRNEDGTSVTEEDIRSTAGKTKDWDSELDIAFRPTRILTHDMGGIPVLLALAALRDKAADLGMDPMRINPQVRTDLIIDHSVQVHATRSADALGDNLSREFHDNAERYSFVKWAQTAFDGLSVVPPGKGICHQINIEHLSEVVSALKANGSTWLMPDTMIGTDSHTPMVNALGVVGWGVGGIEAEAVMLGEPISMLVPPVIGVKLTGSPKPGTLATDIVLNLTEALRKKGVVGAILEFFGPGVASLGFADRATMSNMTPEFGATCSFFPTDERTIEYMHLTGRDAAAIERVESYLKHNGLWFDPDFVPDCADVMEFDLGNVRRTVSGPKRPEQRRDLAEVPGVARELFDTETPEDRLVKNGDVVIAAITSCTNTSNPATMIAAGLLAKNAVARGLSVKDTVKTSMAPGSQVVMDYLDKAGLTEPLEKLGFSLVGYGCTTCMGNSGDLAADVTKEIDDNDLTVAAVLSGNRNFEGRVHPKAKANFLAAPPLVVAYAIAGSVLKDLTSEPLGTGSDGKPVMLADIWPDPDEIAAVIESSVSRDAFIERYSKITEGTAEWDALPAPTGPRFVWSEDSTYFQRPPFFDLKPEFVPGKPMIEAARPLLLLGDSVTTDHISPVGNIAGDSPAAKYLLDRGVEPKDFNYYGSRRAHHDIMTRGTFANIRLQNELADGKTGFWTRVMPDGELMTIFDATEVYKARGESTVVVAGKGYGTGSARDWAAKGTRLLGITAVLAESFERIHRSNLVRIGVLPLEFTDGATKESLGIDRHATIDLPASIDSLAPRAKLTARVTRGDGTSVEFTVIARVDTPDELRYLKDGGILNSVAKTLLDAA